MSVQFTLDTSGRVECPASFQPLGWAIWSDFAPFAQGYVQAMPWQRLEATLCKLEGEEGRHLGFRDLSAQAVELILKDCERRTRFYSDRALAPDMGSAFWRNRQAGRYVTAFEPEKPFPPLTVSLGDDGKVYLHQEQPRHG